MGITTHSKRAIKVSPIRMPLFLFLSDFCSNLEIDSTSAMSIDATRKVDLYITYIKNISYTVMACGRLCTKKGQIERCLRAYFFTSYRLAGFDICSANRSRSLSVLRPGIARTWFQIGRVPTTFTGDQNMIRTLSYAAAVALAFVLPAAAENAKVNVPATASDISSAAN
jgi:hypothetical protein